MIFTWSSRISPSSRIEIIAVDYMFPKPGGTEPMPKQTFVTRVGDQGCGVGYYK